MEPFDDDDVTDCDDNDDDDDDTDCDDNEYDKRDDNNDDYDGSATKTAASAIDDEEEK